MVVADIQEQRGLGRRPEFDEASKLYQLRTILTVEQIIPRSYTWHPGAQLDQDGSGRCVGYGCCGELGSRPVIWPATNTLANTIYELACRRDEFTQNDSGDIYFGSSVLAGMKALKDLGFIPEYRWVGAGSGKALADFALGLAYHGPVIVGTNWYASMDTPTPDGHIVVNINSGIRGGHCYFFYKIAIKWLNNIRPAFPTFDDVDLDRSFAWIRNSWGGLCNGYMTLREVYDLLHNGGEGVVIMRRQHTT